MKPKITIAITGELGYYQASTMIQNVMVQADARITLLGAFNALGTKVFKETGIMLLDHPLTINYQPELMPITDKPSRS
jgi:hypothetical protein